MKAKMKKLISIKSIPILALALLIVLGSALAAGRDPVSGSGEATLDLSTGAATGTATLNIRGEEFTTLVAVQITGQVISDEGVTHVTSTHTFTFDNGSITTTDKGVIDTDGTLNEHLTIISGTDDFEGACGELRVHGQIQFQPPMAYVSYDIRGAISR